MDEASKHKKFLENYLKMPSLNFNNNNELDRDDDDDDIMTEILQSNSYYLNSIIQQHQEQQQKQRNDNYEHCRFDWEISEEELNEWENNTIIALKSLEECNDFNHQLNKRSECHLKSPEVQCGLLVNRCANWHWELRITEVNEQEEEKENINDVMSKVKKYVGLYIFLDNAKLSLNFTSGWDFNEKLNVLINVQLLQSNNNVIFTSAKTEMLSFGFNSPFLQSTCFPDFIPWEEFLNLKSTLFPKITEAEADPSITRPKQKVRSIKIRVKMDLFGEPNEKFKFKPSLKSKKNKHTEQDLEEDENEDPIINNCAIIDIKGDGKGLGTCAQIEMKKLLISGIGSDVLVFVKGEEVFKVHGELIKIRAPGLASMINEQNTINIIEDDFDKEVIQILMEYIYTDKITFSQSKPIGPELINTLLAAGHIFRIKNFKYDFMERLASHLGLTVEENCDDEKAAELTKSSFEFKEENPIHDAYLIAMDEFSKESKEEQMKLTDQFSKIFYEDKDAASNRILVPPKPSLKTVIAIKQNNDKTAGTVVKCKSLEQMSTGKKNPKKLNTNSKEMPQQKVNSKKTLVKNPSPGWR